MDRKVLSVLLGLIGACESHRKTTRTDAVVLRALAGPGGADERIAELRAEKAAIAPDCAMCAMPCGNTSDFDLSRLDAEAPEIRAEKRRLLEAAQKKAASLLTAPRPDCEALYAALSALRCEMSRAELERLRAPLA